MGCSGGGGGEAEGRKGQRRFCNYIILPHSAACVPSVNQRQRVRRLEQMAEEGIEPVIDIISAERRKRKTEVPKDTSFSPSLNVRLFCTLAY